MSQVVKLANHFLDATCVAFRLSHHGIHQLLSISCLIQFEYVKLLELAQDSDSAHAYQQGKV